MRRLTVICVLPVLLLASSNAIANLVDFEGVPAAYHYPGDLGHYYPGLYFWPGATIIDNPYYYPPHSGISELQGVGNSTIRVDFDAGATYAEVWYVSAHPFYMEAYGAGNVLLDSDSGIANWGDNSLLLSVSGGNIAYVLFHDSGNAYTLDDLKYTPVATPVPAAVLLGILGLSTAGLKLRKFV